MPEPDMKSVGPVAGADAELKVRLRVWLIGEPAGVGSGEMNSWTGRSQGDASICRTSEHTYRYRRHQHCMLQTKGQDQAVEGKFLSNGLHLLQDGNAWPQHCQ